MTLAMLELFGGMGNTCENKITNTETSRLAQ